MKKQPTEFVTGVTLVSIWSYDKCYCMTLLLFVNSHENYVGIDDKGIESTNMQKSATPRASPWLPESWRRRTPSWVPQYAESRMIVLARSSSNLPNWITDQRTDHRDIHSAFHENQISAHNLDAPILTGKREQISAMSPMCDHIVEIVWKQIGILETRDLYCSLSCARLRTSC